jgi:hypothetical protein
MTQIQKIHYTAGGNPSHCGVFILPNGKDIEYIVIDHIEWREKEVVNGIEKAVFVALFKENPYTKLPMVLNRVNKERLIKLAGIGGFDLLSIKDMPVRLTYEPTRIGDGLRISKLPATQPMAEKKKKKFSDADMPAAIKFLKSGTIEQLEEYYDIPNDIREALINKK